MKRGIIVAIIILIIVVAFGLGYLFTSYLNKGNTSDNNSFGYNYILSSDTILYRERTFEDCQDLLGTNNFEGKVIFEECGKNCLGGCSNSGPVYCAYGVIDENGCVIYVKSQIRGFDMFEKSSKIFNEYKIGERIMLTEEISLYSNGHCDVDKNPSCNYFISGSAF
ncbi:MAG: hypothetical protein U9Q06_01275 [Nanoarchaeota archaeon]|nr:hypothetical protein [Nanoarchaeota archaeon]